MDREGLLSLIKHFGGAPDEQLDAELAKRCRDFDRSSNPVPFLRNLLDMVVHTGGGSGLVVEVLEAALASKPPEPGPEQNYRRYQLEKGEWWVPKESASA